MIGPGCANNLDRPSLRSGTAVPPLTPKEGRDGDDHRRSCAGDHRWCRHPPDVHVAAALDPLGGLLGTESFATDPAGYKALLSWLASFGDVTKIGVEGTGSYGAGLARHLRRAGVEVIEVDRPNRQKRRSSGKSDPLDAVEAARAALGGRATGSPKSRDGAVEAIRVLVVAKRSARQARVKAILQMLISATALLNSSVAA